jgi:anti-sigma B factor antagonist
VSAGGRRLAAGQKGGSTVDEFTITGSADPDGLRLRGSRPRPDTVRLAVTGAIDVSNASLLRAGVQDAVDAGEAAAFELDLAGVPMLDSTGVGTLVACRAAVQRVGLRFAVVATRPIVYRILQVVGVIEALNVSVSAEPNGGERGRLRAAGGDAGDDPDGRS